MHCISIVKVSQHSVHEEMLTDCTKKLRFKGDFCKLVKSGCIAGHSRSKAVVVLTDRMMQNPVGGACSDLSKLTNEGFSKRGFKETRKVKLKLIKNSAIPNQTSRCC